jgi:hypothetical protein
MEDLRTGLPTPRRRTFATGILPFAHSMLTALRHPACAGQQRRLSGHGQPLTRLAKQSWASRDRRKLEELLDFSTFWGMRCRRSYKEKKPLRRDFCRPGGASQLTPLQSRDALGRRVLTRGLQSLHRRWRRGRQHESAARWRQRLRCGKRLR